MNYKTTVISIAIHNEKENPIFGEDVIHIRLEDEACGGFFVISQSGNTEIKIDPDELQLMAKEGQKMLAEYESITNTSLPV